MKIPRILRRKKLRATTATRRSLRASAEMSYDDLSEPNMKLSRALLIVLVLHIVAVSGIVAFNAIKSRDVSFVKSAPAGSIRQDVGQHGQDVAASVAPNPESISKAAKPVIASPKSVARNDHALDHAKSVEHEPADSGKVYTVVKGDNPVAIAKKFKVAYDDLIELNHIRDPRKLQIGTKLLIPRTNNKADK